MKLDKAAILIKKAALEFDKIASSELERYDLTPSQYKVLRYVYTEAEHGVRIVDLEKYYSMSHPTAIGIVHNLAKKGLVDYQENPHDGRSRYIVPTPQARAQHQELEGVGETLDHELTGRLSERERLRLVALLQKMLGIAAT